MFKSISSKKLREEFLPQIKKYIWKEGTLWGIGYYVASVSDGATTDVVTRYIKTQWSRPYKKPNVYDKLKELQKSVLAKDIMQDPTIKNLIEETNLTVG